MLDDIISGGFKLLGGLMGQNSADKDREQREAHALRQEAIQREFAQNGIQWKVQDAKKAGIHPLAALGANATSYAPVSVGSSSGSPMASAVSSMGQDIGRAVYSTQSQDTRDTMFRESVRQLELTNYTLKNDLLASQIAKLKAAGNPPMPSLGTATEAPPDKLATRGRPVIGSTEVRGHPGYMSAEHATNEWGEGAGDWVYGPLKMYMDWAYHQSGARSGDQYRGIVNDNWRRRREKPLGQNVRHGGGGW